MAKNIKVVKFSFSYIQNEWEIKKKNKKINKKVSSSFNLKFFYAVLNVDWFINEMIIQWDFKKFFSKNLNVGWGEEKGP